MKAIVCKGINMPLALEEVPKPVLEKGDALVKIKAAAFNHRDWWIQQGQYAGLKFPIILGSDGCGVVEAVADDVSADWLNREVVINPSLNWGDSLAFHSKDFKILGLPDNGCMAEYVKVPAINLYAKPTYLKTIEAAVIPLSGLTGYRALFTRGQLKKGDNLLLTGIGGGVALMMLQMAVAIGANVYVTSGNDEKIEQARKLGAKDGVNYKKEDWHKELLGKTDGFDVIVDSAAGEGFKFLAEMARPGGRIVFFGGTQGAINGLIPQRVFYKHLNILGTTMGSPVEFEEMLRLFDKFSIHPVIDKVFPVNEAENAIRRMDNHQQFGKIALSIENNNDNA